MKIREIMLAASAIPDEPAGAVVALLIVLLLGAFLGIEFLMTRAINAGFGSFRTRR